jgi:hypothetical protein
MFMAVITRPGECGAFPEKNQVQCFINPGIPGGCAQIPLPLNLILKRYLVTSPPELTRPVVSPSPHIFLYKKSLLFRGGRTNQIPLTIKPYPMKTLI